MKINLIQNITKILDEDRKEISSSISEYYMLKPEAGKALYNKITGNISSGVVYIPRLKSKENYEEIDLKDNDTK